MSMMLLLFSTLIAGSWGLLMNGSTTSNATTVSTPTQRAVFSNNRDRDNFIMDLSSSIKDVKTDLAALLKLADKNHKQNTGTGTGTTVPPKFVAFMVRLTPRLSHLGKGQIIRFDDVVVNRGNGYDARLGVFRCPLTGTYQFSLAIGSFGGIQLDIVRNGIQIGRVFSARSRFGRDVGAVQPGLAVRQHLDGSDYTASYNNPPSTPSPLKPVRPGSEAHSASTQAIVDVQEGDEVWVVHTTESQHDILFGDGMTTFSGHLLSAK